MNINVYSIRTWLWILMCTAFEHDLKQTPFIFISLLNTTFLQRIRVKIVKICSTWPWKVYRLNDRLPQCHCFRDCYLNVGHCLGNILKLWIYSFNMFLQYTRHKEHVLLVTAAYMCRFSPLNPHMQAVITIWLYDYGKEHTKQRNISWNNKENLLLKIWIES